MDNNNNNSSHINARDNNRQSGGTKPKAKAQAGAWKERQKLWQGDESALNRSQSSAKWARLPTTPPGTRPILGPLYRPTTTATFPRART